MNADVEQARVFGPLDYAVRERSLEELGEDRQHMEDHGRFKSFNPSGNSTAMRRPAGSISTQIARVNGISRPPTTSNPERPPQPPPAPHHHTRACAVTPSGAAAGRFAGPPVDHIAAYQIGLKVFAWIQRNTLACGN